MLQTELRPVPLEDRFELEALPEIEAAVLQSIREAFKGLRFGEVNITVRMDTSSRSNASPASDTSSPNACISDTWL